MTIASHAKGRGFNPLTAHDYRLENTIIGEEGAFALIHDHLISLASLSEISGRSGAFLFHVLPLAHDNLHLGAAIPQGADSVGGDL